MTHVTDRQLLRHVAASVLFASACLAVAGCAKPNPPLVPPDRAAALAAIKGPNAGWMNAGSADDLVILTGAALRNRAQADFKGVIASYWPPAPSSGAASRRVAFANFGDPTVDCSTIAKDGTFCSLTFAGNPTPNMTLGLAPMAPTFHLPASVVAREIAIDDAGLAAEAKAATLLVRLGIDDGSAEFAAALPDPRPLLDAGDVAVATGIDGTVDAGPLGTLHADCLTDTPIGGEWQRRVCSAPYGPYVVSVSRDIVASAAPMKDLADDPELMRDMVDASKLLASALLRSPPLRHALPPVRLADNPGGMIMSIATGAADSSEETRALIAKNGARLPWHDLAGQGDFDTLCRAAADADRPLLILTIGPSEVAAEMLYMDEFMPFAGHAMLAVVQLSPNLDENPWARAFDKAIGGSNFDTLTATDRPRIRGDVCTVGRVYQAPSDSVSPQAIDEALLTGRPPAQVPVPPKTN